MSGMDTKEKMIRRKMPESLLLVGIVLFFSLLALFLQGIPALAAIPEEWKREFPQSCSLFCCSWFYMEW